MMYGVYFHTCILHNSYYLPSYVLWFGHLTRWHDFFDLLKITGVADGCSLHDFGEMAMSLVPKNYNEYLMCVAFQ